MPVTSTKVSDETAATSWRTAELTAFAAPRSAVLRRIGNCWLATGEQFNQPVTKLPRSAVRRMTNVWSFHDTGREPADRNDTAVSRHRVEKRRRCLDLGPGGPPIRARFAASVRMRRHDVPEQNALFEPQLGEHAVDNSRSRLRGPGSRQLTLGRKRQTGDTRASIARRFADEQNRGIPPEVQVLH
jgi:hypothetical protein